MLERLAVAAIVLAAVLYSVWALMPAAPRQRAAARLLPLANAAACPAWLRRRIHTAAEHPSAGGPCSGCSAAAEHDDGTR